MGQWFWSKHDTRSRAALLLVLCRQLVAIRRGRYFEGIDDTGQEPVVVGGYRQLDQPLHVMAILQRIERRLVNTIVLDQLPSVGHDVPLCGGKLGGISLGTDEIDGFLTHPGTACCPDLGRPYVLSLAL